MKNNVSTIKNSAINGTVVGLVLASDAAAAKFEQQTGWSWSDAVDMAAECRQEDRLFGNRRSRTRSSRRRQQPISGSFERKFKETTGWNYGDAVDMAAEAQRDERLFGNRYLN